MQSLLNKTADDIYSSLIEGKFITEQPYDANALKCEIAEIIQKNLTGGPNYPFTTTTKDTATTVTYTV